MKNESYIMQHLKFTTARSRLIAITALLLATALGGCVAYTGYPSSNYSYSYPNGYYTEYPRTYTNAPAYRPFYSPTYYDNGSSY